MKNKFRDVCDACYKEEEKQFDAVYKFLRNRENRAATIPRVVEATGVDEDLLLKFIRTGRIKVTSFPNLGYPCDKCGTLIKKGKLCDDCADELRAELEIFNKEENRRKELEEREKHSTYLTSSVRKRGF
jgi:flagellar operon protein (TIGR03826 family)